MANDYLLQAEIAAIKQELSETRRPKADVSDQIKPLQARIAELTAAVRRSQEDVKQREVIYALIADNGCLHRASGASAGFPGETSAG